MNGFYYSPDRANLHHVRFAAFHDDSPEAMIINTLHLILSVDHVTYPFVIERNILTAQRQLEEKRQIKAPDSHQSACLFIQNKVYTEMLKSSSGLELGSKPVPQDEPTLVAFQGLLHDITQRVEQKVPQSLQAKITHAVDKAFRKPIHE